MSHNTKEIVGNIWEFRWVLFIIKNSNWYSFVLQLIVILKMTQKIFSLIWWFIDSWLQNCRFDFFENAMTVQLSTNLNRFLSRIWLKFCSFSAMKMLEYHLLAYSYWEEKSSLSWFFIHPHLDNFPENRNGNSFCFSGRCCFYWRLCINSKINANSYTFPRTFPLFIEALAMWCYILRKNKLATWMVSSSINSMCVRVCVLQCSPLPRNNPFSILMPLLRHTVQHSKVWLTGLV